VQNFYFFLMNRTFGTDNLVAFTAEVFSYDAFKSYFCSHKNVAVNGSTQAEEVHFRADNRPFSFEMVILP
jgi:hypothetical protein